MNLTNIKRLTNFIETDAPARMRTLEAEKAELQERITKLKASVSRGNAKNVTDLAIAKERLEVIPDEIKALNDEYAGAMRELREELLKAGYQCGNMRVAEEDRISSACDEFLKQFILSDYGRRHIIQQILAVNIRVEKFNSLQNSFGMLQIVKNPDKSTLLSHANVAIRELSNV